ncbi:MAG: hypothetical protein ABEJ59_05650 [Halanaeroarchaeum sp.]
MSSPSISPFDSLRRPEYTGANRCTPCSIVNVLVAGVVSAVLWALFWPWLAVTALAVSLGAIYFRGYLVPGTPTLTKRYFPDVVLRAFDKDPSLAATNGQAPQHDLERLLLDSGLVVDCPDDDDLCLDPGFRADWFDRIQSVRTREDSRETLAPLLDVDPERIEYYTFDDAFVMTVDDRRVGRWESSAAFHADVAGAELLPDRFPAW